MNGYPQWKLGFRPGRKWKMEKQQEREKESWRGRKKKGWKTMLGKKGNEKREDAAEDGKQRSPEGQKKRERRE